MAAYAGYVPIVQSRFFLEGLFSSERFAQLMATGVLNIDHLQEVQIKADYITLPQAQQVDDFSSVDLTSTDVGSSTRVTTNNGRAPVVRHYTMKQATRHDDLRTGENWAELMAGTAGNKAAKDIIKTAVAAMKGALAVSGVNHTYDVTAITGTASGALAGSLTVDALRNAKVLLGDQGEYITAALLHSKQWNQLLFDLQNNYKY